MLLCTCLQVSGHEVLPALSILEEGEVEESLLLVEVSSAFSVLKRKGCQHILKSIVAHNV